MQTIKEAVASVQNAPTSIFAKEDVIKILKSIQTEGESGSIDFKDLIETVKSHVKDAVDNFDNSMIDTSSASFSLNYNEIELDSVDFDTKEMVDYLETAVDDAFSEWEEEQEKEKEEVA